MVPPGISFCSRLGAEVGLFWLVRGRGMVAAWSAGLVGRRGQGRGGGLGGGDNGGHDQPPLRPALPTTPNCGEQVCKRVTTPEVVDQHSPSPLVWNKAHEGLACSATYNFAGPLAPSQHELLPL